MPTSCPWCTRPATDEDHDPDPDHLCPTHAAEYDGLSLIQAQRRDAIEYAEECEATAREYENPGR
ncbi:hypothetical protein AB0L82_35960 [Nocardia sp. NPDC052001]|uniref:hypothetical protein n=1 Tax=Nocardia sp. NPDC052001 TaxID=3154853 RepID=UPI00341E506F